MDSKRVFILRTDFSKQAGMPLTMEMTPLSMHLLGESYARYDRALMREINR